MGKMGNLSGEAARKRILETAIEEETRASAGSGDLLPFWRLLRGRSQLTEVLHLLTAVVFAGPRLDLRRAQQPLRFHDGPLAMHPARLDRVEPRALARQPAHHDPHAPVLLGPSVVCLDPAAHQPANVP